MRYYARQRVAGRKVDTFLSLICNVIMAIIIIVMFRGVGRGGLGSS